MTDFEKDLLERMGELNEADLELLFDDSCWGEDVPALDSKTVKRIQKKTYQKLNKKLLRLPKLLLCHGRSLLSYFLYLLYYNSHLFNFLSVLFYLFLRSH